MLQIFLIKNVNTICFLWLASKKDNKNVLEVHAKGTCSIASDKEFAVSQFFSLKDLADWTFLCNFVVGKPIKEREP